MFVFASETNRAACRPPEVAAQIAPEMRAWIRDNLSIESEALTSALTFSTVFAQPPSVVGEAWEEGGQCWWVGIDHPTKEHDSQRHDKWRNEPWPSSTLIVINEARDGPTGVRVC